MKPEIKQKWVAALRSGEYVKGLHRLKRVGSQTTHCCLGVLCELYIKENPSLKWVVSENGQPKLLESDAYLPKEVLDWAGLDTRDPRTLNNDYSLSSLNDNGTSTFESIAKIIEAEL